jgi:perosamine synthetase
VRNRAALARRYAARLANVDGVCVLRVPEGTEPSWFVYPVRLSPEIDRDAVMRGMAARGITTRPYFRPIHLQPFYADRFGFTEGDFPAAEAAGRSMLSLPLSPGLSDADLDAVCTALAEEVRRA